MAHDVTNVLSHLNLRTTFGFANLCPKSTAPTNHFDFQRVYFIFSGLSFDQNYIKLI